MLIQKSILKYTSMDYLQDFSIIKVFANTVLIVNETICWAYRMSIRLTGFILFVKYTNCGWGHLLCRLNKRDGLSGVERTRIEVSHIPPLVCILDQFTVLNSRNLPYYICFWGTPLPPPTADIICTCPLTPLHIVWTSRRRRRRDVSKVH